MRTTVVIDDAIYKRTRERAAALDTTVSELVNQALREALSKVPPQTLKFEMLTFGDSATKSRHEPGDFADLLAADDEQGLGR